MYMWVHKILHHVLVEKEIAQEKVHMKLMNDEENVEGQMWQVGFWD